MTKKKEQIVTVSENWIKIMDRIIDDYIAKNSHLMKNKRIKLNLAVCLYLIYDLLYKKHKNDDLLMDSFTLNYDCLKEWSSLGNNFYKFFKYLLDSQVLIRWESNTIDKRTKRPIPYYYHIQGVTGTCAQYKLNPKIIKAIENQPEVTISLTVSQKNDYFFNTIPRYKRKLAWWKKNDVYKDYREPNDYELKNMDRLKHIIVPKEYFEGEMEPIFIHGRIYLNGWTNIDKDLRYTVLYKGLPMAEAFDVKNCYVQFTAAKLEEIEGIEKSELDHFCDLAYSGKFYQFLAEGTEYTRDDMKKPWMHYLFSSNGTKIKGILNQREFVNGKSVKKHSLVYVAKWNTVRWKMETFFPSIHKFLSHYKQIKVDGRNVSKLSVELQWIENQYVLNMLMKMMEEKGLIKDPIPLHDAIYLSSDQVTDDLKFKIDTVWKRILEKHIRKQPEDELDRQIRETEQKIKNHEFIKQYQESLKSKETPYWKKVEDNWPEQIEIKL